jgi:predicted alpha-1,2-mannosidase
MTGLHVMPFIADCYQKGIRNYDANAVFEAMKSTAMRDTTGFSMRYFTGLKNYKKYGYIPADLEMESVARTLDYAYDDWCIAQMANMLDKKQDYNYFLKRSSSYRNVYDSTTGFMRGRLADGSWRTPFDPFASSHRRDDFCEGNSWQWTFSVAHDVKGLAQLMGGKEKLIAKLDTFFNLSSKIHGEFASGDISGMIGQYAHGNEPGHHTIFMYSYLGQPSKTQQYVHQVLTTLYDNTPEGICGNEDTGQMSAWYVLSSMGFYPVRHGDGTYIIASPSFKKVSIRLPGGKELIIKTDNLSDANIYIQSVLVNGKDYSKTYFLHDELMKGGEIAFKMGPQPNSCWGVNETDLPPSLIDELKQLK